MMRIERTMHRAGDAGLALLAAVFLGACAAGLPSDPGERPAPAAADILTLHLLGTTDVHGRLYPYDYYSGRATDHGLALLAPLIDSVRSAHPGRVYLFDSGDWLQGNPLTSVYARSLAAEPNPVVRAQNLLGYDAVVLGNHEFNYGIPYLEAAIARAGFPVISANIFRHASAERAFPASALIPHAVSERDTLLIGVTGVTPPGVAIWDRANVEGRLDFRDIVASVEPVVRELRSAGADLVVVLAHSGLEGSSYSTATGVPPENDVARMAREVAGIDVVLMGHSHGEIADTTIAGVLIAQPKNWAASLVAVRVTMERRGAGDWARISAEGELLRPDPARPDTAFLDSLRWQHERVVAHVNSVVAEATEELSAVEARVRPTPILDLVNQVQREAAGADLSATAAFNTGARLPRGSVTVGDIAGLYIYENTLRAIRITGEQLRLYLEKSAEYYRRWPVAEGESLVNPEVPGYNFDVVSGVEYTIDLRRPVGSRIVGLSHDGTPVRPDQTFTLALNNYRQAGGGGFDMIADAPVVHHGEEDVRDLLIAAIRARGTVDPAEVERSNWRIVPEEAEEAALAEHRRAAGATASRDAATDAGDTTGDAADDHAADAAPVARLRVLSTTDFHGALEPHSAGWTGGRMVGGAAALASYFRLESEGFGGPTLLLSSGDIYQGTPISNLTEGRSTIDYYNLAGYGAAALGNHEFDWGIPVLEERIRQAAFPFLGANVVVRGSDTLPDWAEPVARLDVDGVRVAVIGISTERTPETTRAVNVRDLEFRDPATIIDAWIPRLREEGHDFVLVAAHEGAFCDAAGRSDCRGEIVDVARALRHPPDLILGGHTHVMIATHIDGVPMVQAASRGSRYGVVDLERRAGESRARVWIRGVPIAWVDGVPPDSAAAALVAAYQAEVAPLVGEVVTRLAEPLERAGGEYGLGRLIADAQRWAGEGQIAIMNNGGIRTPLPAGPVTWGDLYKVQPFQNVLVRDVVTGRQLRATIERGITDAGPRVQVSGVRIRYDPRRPAGERVLAIELESGEPVRDGGTYSLVINDFLAERGDGYEELGTPLERTNTGIVDLDALIGYLRTLPVPVRAPAESRIQAVDADADDARGSEGEPPERVLPEAA